jgi:hypothetical protein
MAVIPLRNNNYGFPTPLSAYPPFPIISQRVPTTRDFAQIGTEWVYVPGNAVYFLSSIVSNVANWVNVSGGAGVFTSLTVTPGPISLTGTTTINTTGTALTTIGSGTAGAVSIVSPALSLDSSAAGTIAIGQTIASGSISVGSTLTSGTLALGSATMTGALTIGGSISGQTINMGNAANTGAQVINIANGASGANSTVNILSGAGTAGTQTFNVLATGATRAGVVNIGTGGAAHVVSIGSNTGAASTLINGGTGGVEVSAPFLSLFNTGFAYIYQGSGAPANGLALHIGDLYINSTAASAVTRLYIATGVGAWTNVTCAA